MEGVLDEGRGKDNFSVELGMNAAWQGQMAAQVTGKLLFNFQMPWEW